MLPQRANRQPILALMSAFIAMAACGRIGYDFAEAGDSADAQPGVVDGSRALCSDTRPVGDLPLALGYRHACMLRAGEVWCFGEGAQGNLGNGSTDDVVAPTAVVVFP